MGFTFSSHYSKGVRYICDSDSNGGDKKDGEIGVTAEKYGSTDSLTHCRVRH